MTKTCSRCKAEKDVDDFGKSTGRKDGRLGHCKLCHNQDTAKWYASNTGKRKEGFSKWYAKSPERRRVIRLRGVYRITPQRFDEILESQEGKCAICRVVLDSKSHRTKPHIDHDHACCPSGRSCGGCVRGLLCTNCNSMLGKARDNVASLRAGADYVEMYQRLRTQQTV